MEERIKKVLIERVDPILENHFGGSEFVSYENGIVFVRLTGACGGCPSAQYTVEDIIKAELMDAIPEIEDVKLDTSVSPDLIDMAKKILNKEV